MIVWMTVAHAGAPDWQQLPAASPLVESSVDEAPVATPIREKPRAPTREERIELNAGLEAAGARLMALAQAPRYRLERSAPPAVPEVLRSDPVAPWLDGAGTLVPAEEPWTSDGDLATSSARVTMGEGAPRAAAFVLRRIVRDGPESYALYSQVLLDLDEAGRPTSMVVWEGLPCPDELPLTSGNATLELPRADEWSGAITTFERDSLGRVTGVVRLGHLLTERLAP